MTSEAKIVAGGFKNLLILTDFDRTLTQAFVHGKSTSLISTMVRDKLFDDDYIEKATKSYAIYRPIELDESLPRKYRAEKMQEWWEYACQVLIDKKLSKAKIKLAMTKSQQQLRTGVKEFLTTLNDHQVPVLIISASGLGTESIEYFLEKNQLMLPNIHIFCNQFIWDKNGVAVDYEKPLIHAFNKDFKLVKKSPIYAKIKTRQNVIAIGDGVGDMDMLNNCDYANLLKVGFLNEEIEKSRDTFQHVFDKVIEEDGDFAYLNQLLTKF
jgi:HAD superfamily hydrolase (TIGR01544 family)